MKIIRNYNKIIKYYNQIIQTIKKISISFIVIK